MGSIAVSVRPIAWLARLGWTWWNPAGGPRSLGRVPKRRILEAVREGAGERAAQLIDHLKKGEMAKEAERLLADTGWLPEPLRLTDGDPAAEIASTSGEVEALPEFLAGDDGEAAPDDAEEPQPQVAAAE
jgi:ParB family chromosome partitioning protein